MNVARSSCDAADRPDAPEAILGSRKRRKVKYTLTENSARILHFQNAEITRKNGLAEATPAQVELSLGQAKWGKDAKRNVCQKMAQGAALGGA